MCSSAYLWLIRLTIDARMQAGEWEALLQTAQIWPSPVDKDTKFGQLNLSLWLFIRDRCNLLPCADPDAFDPDPAGLPEVCQLYFDAMIGDTFCSLFDKNTVEAPHGMARAMLEAYAFVDEQQSVLLGVNPSIIGPYDDVMKVMRVISALSNPEPHLHSTTYKEVLEMLDSANFKALPDHLKHTRTAIMKSKLWAPIVASYWVSAAKDDAVGPPFQAALKMFQSMNLQKAIPREALQNVCDNTPTWRSETRDGGMARLDNIMVPISKKFWADLEGAEEPSEEDTDLLVNLVQVIDSNKTNEELQLIRKKALVAKHSRTKVEVVRKFTEESKVGHLSSCISPGL